MECHPFFLGEAEDQADLLQPPPGEARTAAQELAGEAGPGAQLVIDLLARQLDDRQEGLHQAQRLLRLLLGRRHLLRRLAGQEVAAVVVVAVFCHFISIAARIHFCHLDAESPPAGRSGEAPKAQKWVFGFAEPERAAATLELVPART